MGMVWPVVLLAILLIVAAVLLVVLIVLFVRNCRRYGSVMPPRRQMPQAQQPSSHPLPQRPSPAPPAVAQQAVVAQQAAVSQPGAAAPNTAYLEQVSGGGAAIFPLDRSVTVIGRDPACDIRIDERFVTVSRRHAQITREQDSYVLSDLNSSSGVYVDGARIGRNRVRNGAIIQLGEEVQYRFHLAGARGAP